MARPYENQRNTLLTGANCSRVIVPSDTVDLPFATKAIYVGGAGDVAMIMDGDTVAVTRKNMAAGVAHVMQVRRVLVTGTTATFMLADF